jgi:hypothetical protein
MITTFPCTLVRWGANRAGVARGMVDAPNVLGVTLGAAAMHPNVS